MTDLSSLKINGPSSTWNPSTSTITDIPDTYSLTEIPDTSSEWVQEARGGILFHIDLEDLIADLANAGDLIYLAVNGAKEDEIGINLDNLQGDLLRLVGDCRTTMQDFAANSAAASLALQSAFKELFKGEENLALGKLNDISKIARDMNIQAIKIRDRFEAFTNLVQEQANLLQGKVVTSYEELNELKDINNQLRADVSEQQSIERELNILIGELTDDLAEAKATAKDQETKAFVLQLVGGLFNAVGAGLGAYAMSQNPVAMVTNVAKNTATTITDSKSKVEEEKAKLDPEKKKELDEKIKEQQEAANEKNEAEEDVKDVDAALNEILADLKAFEKEIGAADKEIEVADKEIAEVEANTQLGKREKKNKTKIPAEIKKKAINKKTVQTLQLNQAEEDKKSKEVELKEAEAILITAKEKWEKAKAAVNAFSAGLNKLGETVENMSNKAERRAETARDTMNEILKLKRDAQSKKRDSTAQVQKLLVKLKGNVAAQDRKENTMHCFGISIWALNNLFVTFERASFFWSNIAKAAEKLADPKIQKLIQSVIDEIDDPQKRIEYYKSESFVRMSISSVVNWKALNSICVEYGRAIDSVHTKVEENKGKSLTIEEAGKAIDGLKIDLENRMSYLQKETDKNIDKLEASSEGLEQLDLKTVV